MRLIDILSAKGLIERRQDPSDRRSNLLFLTQAGKSAVQDIHRVLLEVETQMFADVDDAEIAALTDAIERIDARVKSLRREELTRT